MKRPALALWVALAGCDGDLDKPPPTGPGPATESTGDTGAGTTEPVDSDGDGFVDAEDCAPEDPTIFPGAMERCNGLDDDCDGQPHPYTDQDFDGDGFAWCLECDDRDPAAFPGAPDPIDGVDQDCDGTDGQGSALSGATYLGTTTYGLFGFELVAGDFDGDGCDDLVIGQPGYDISADVSSVSLRRGCGSGALVTYERGGAGIGSDLDVDLGLVTFNDPYNVVGRALLFDSAFGPDAEPVLEIHADGADMTESVALLGSPAEWLVTSGWSWNLGPQHYNLFSVERRGLVRLLDESPDLQIWSDSYYLDVGYLLADVGDRDGDGETDLAFGLPDPAIEAVAFFPQIYEAHVDDAPERWLGPAESYTGFGMAGDADLDGDGLDDAIVQADYADGQQQNSSVAYVAPWRGAGEHSLEDEAPARVLGEFTLDLPVTAQGDLDGDGYDDLVVGAPGLWLYVIRAGKVMVFRGPLSGTYTAADADLLWVGEHLGDHAGRGLALGDFDGSGRGDIAIGAPFARGDAEEAGGAVYILHDPL